MSNNFSRAPTFYIDSDPITLQERSEITTAIFNQLDGKQGNLIKLLITLLYTKGDGSFKISEQWILNKTGMTQPRYIDARKALINKKWLTHEPGKIILNTNIIIQTYVEKQLYIR